MPLHASDDGESVRIKKTKAGSEDEDPKGSKKARRRLKTLDHAPRRGIHGMED